MVRENVGQTTVCAVRKLSPLISISLHPSKCKYVFFCFSLLNVCSLHLSLPLLSLMDDHSAIQISSNQNYGIIEIMDDDGTLMLHTACFLLFYTALNLHSLFASCSFCSCWNRSGEDCLHYELYC